MSDSDLYALPASFAQQRMWFMQQLEPHIPLYNLGQAYRLEGALDLCALEGSLGALIERHEALRTTFTLAGDQPVQVIHRRLHSPLRVSDPGPHADLLPLIAAEARQPFDLVNGPLLRVLLLRRSAHEHVLVRSLHHAIIDGWSAGVFVREWSALYAAYLQYQPARLPPLPIQYADFSLWQREWLQGETLDRLLGYWRQQLRALSPLDLPADRARPARPTYQSACHRFSLSASLTQRLKQLSRSEHTSLYSVLLAALHVLLHRYSAQDDIAVGSPIANRNRAELEGLIGVCVNTLVMRGDLAGNPSFRALLRRTRALTLEAFAHQDLPFEKLVEALQPARSPNRHPLFQIMFALQNMPPAEPSFAGVRVTRLPLEPQASLFDLSLVMSEQPDGLHAQFEYSVELFDAPTIARMAAHLTRLLESSAADADQPIGALPMLVAAERQQLLVGWNQTARSYPREQCVHRLFEQQVLRTPEAVAVVDADRSLSYRELNAQANQLARHLRAHGAVAGSMIGICLERSPELLIAMLAVLKLGGAYLPLAPADPPGRLRRILADARASLLITQAHSPPMPADVKTVCVAGYGGYSAENLYSHARSDDLAYVMYTSGSTGAPKGVAVPHRAIVNLVVNAGYVQLDSSDVVAFASNPAFDACTFEVWGALLHGARLVVVPTLVLLSPRECAQTIARERITTLFLTTALFNQFARHAPDAFRPLRYLLFGGETSHAPSVARVLAHGPPQHLLHMYGPTETTTFAAWYEVRAVPDGATTLPIGRPLANTQLYILDRELNPQPVGVSGELCIGGDGVACGYLYQAELTAERFIADPFREGGHRLYRTGDLARRLPDGTIEFVGRCDEQVKLRGFRIELGEIYATLLQHPAVADARVLVREANDDRQLVAYVLAQTPTSADELRAFLQARLPAYMLPSTFSFVTHWPLNVNGKLDERALLAAPMPEPQISTHTTRNPVEAKLARLWAELLGVPRVAPHDDFFALGGHSLLALRLFVRIEAEFGVRLPLATLFAAPTVALLAAQLTPQASPAQPATLVLIQPGAERPPFFCVHGYGGGVLGYAELARRLGPDQPFYGLQAHGVDGVADVDRTITAMAARYVNALRSIQPHGPYRIGGYCLGGVVAFEMACQLRAAGEAVALLAILEGYAPARFHQRIALLHPQRLLMFWRSMPYWAEEYLARGATTVRRRGRAMLSQLAPAWLPFDPLSLPDWQLRLMGVQLVALQQYLPQAYDGTVTLFRVRRQTIGKVLLGSGDPALGWAKIAAAVDLKMVEGAHRNMLVSPYVHDLAQQLKASLDVVAAGH